MRLLLCLLFPLSLASKSVADERGVALFPIQSKHFPCETVQTLDTRLKARIAFLWGSFGLGRNCLDQITHSSPEGNVWLIHAMNESCRRFGRCGRGEVLPELSVGQFTGGLVRGNRRVLHRVRSRARAIRLSLGDLPGVRVIVSLALESDWPERAARVVADIFSRELPYELSYNPILRSVNQPLPHGVRYRELHDPEKTCRANQIFVNDGYDLDYPARRSKLRGALSVRRMRKIFERNARGGCSFQFVWSAVIQGRENPSKFVAPRSRRFRVLHSDIRVLNRFAGSEPPPVEEAQEEVQGELRCVEGCS